MEKVLRFVIVAAAMCGGVSGRGADAPRQREYPEMNASQLAEDAAAHGFGPKSPELYRIQILANAGVEIFGRVSAPDGDGSWVGVGHFSLKHGGSGDRGFFPSIKVEDLGGLRAGEMFHAVIYPAELKPKQGPRVYFLSPAAAYLHMKEAKLPEDSVLLQDRQLWAVFVAPETPAPATDEERARARAAIVQQRAAMALPPARIDNFTTLDGKRYDNAIVVAVAGDGVTIETDSEVLRLRFSNLPAETREKYGYDPAKEAAAIEADKKADAAREADKLAMARFLQAAAKEPPKTQTPAPQSTPEPKYSEAFERPDLATVRKYVLESVFRDSTEPATRWNQIPLVSTFGATDEEQKLFLGVVDEINAALAKAPMKLSPGKETLKLAANQKLDEGAAIHVYFCESRQVPGITAKERVAFARREGISWRWWNDDKTLKRGIVVMARNQLDPKQVRRRLLTEMMSVIGFSGYPSTAPLRSVYTLPNVETLQPNDGHLIAFLYGHVAAGMSFDQVKQAVNQYWDEPAPK